MSKRVFLKVCGGDFSAMDFSTNFNAQTVYENMVADGATSVTLETDDCYCEVSIHEFGEIDDAFIRFAMDVWDDYDNMKNEDVFEVKPVETED